MAGTLEIGNLYGNGYAMSQDMHGQDVSAYFDQTEQAIVSISDPVQARVESQAVKKGRKPRSKNGSVASNMSTSIESVASGSIKSATTTAAKKGRKRPITPSYVESEVEGNDGVIESDEDNFSDDDDIVSDTDVSESSEGDEIAQDETNLRKKLVEPKAKKSKPNAKPPRKNAKKVAPAKASKNKKNLVSSPAQPLQSTSNAALNGAKMVSMNDNNMEIIDIKSMPDTLFNGTLDLPEFKEFRTEFHDNWYVQVSKFGGSYHISVREIFVVDKKDVFKRGASLTIKKIGKLMFALTQASKYVEKNAHLMM